jgi:hypothetical protein
MINSFGKWALKLDGLVTSPILAGFKSGPKFSSKGLEKKSGLFGPV